jgi:hypothetical protein
MSTISPAPVATVAATAPKTSTQSSPNVAYQRIEYVALKPRWDKIRHCIAGSDEVKKLGTLYLPMPNATDQTKENIERYNAYRSRAQFYNVTKRTLDGTVGLVFKEEQSDPELPPIIDLLCDDIDGTGMGFHQQAKEVLKHVISFGRIGLFVDYPQVNGVVTKADLDAGNVRPTISLVNPWDIINWRTITIGGVTKLALVVIAEMYVTDDDGFQEELNEQWRVLRLGPQDEKDENSPLVYILEEWIRDPNNRDNFMIKPTQDDRAQYIPLDSAGKPFDYIPFQFIGAENNDSIPDLPPMFDIAELNLGHYRNSADYEESCFIVGQPTPVVIGLTEDWINTVLKGNIQFGSRACIPLPTGADAKLLQCEPNSMPKEAMDTKERQMVALGAKLVQQQTVQRTATEASMENASETSVLGTIVKNVCEGYENAFDMAMDFVDATDDTDIEIELNTSFEDLEVDGQTMTSLMALYNGNVISFEELRTILRRSGFAYLTDEQAKTQIEADALLKPIAAMPGQDPNAPEPGAQDDDPPPPAKPKKKAKVKTGGAS